MVPAIDAMFQSLSLSASAEWEEPFSNMSQTIKDPDSLLKLQNYSPFLHALTRDTCSITRFEGSNKINVVPPTAVAELDCRILPDQDSDAVSYTHLTLPTNREV